MHDKYQEVLIVLVAGILVFVILAGIVIFILLFYQKKRFIHKQQMLEMKISIKEELLRTQLETQEETFLQIGNEIHDNVGQLLSSTKNMLAIASRSFPETPDTLNIASDTLAQAIQELRSLSKTLNKEWLSKFNLVENLALETGRIDMAKRIKIQLICSDTNLPLKPESQVMLFRVVQEALQNAIRHAQATAITVRVNLDAEFIGIIILDNGTGIDGWTEKPGGIGVISMKHRVSLLGGNISWKNGEKSGIEVDITVPLKMNNL